MKKVKLLRDFVPSDLVFKNQRKTESGSRIVDVDSNVFFQTPWLKILYDVDYSICVESELIKDVLEKIDNIVIEYSISELEFSKTEIMNMYRPLLKKSGDDNCFTISVLTNTVLFDNQKNHYDKSEIKTILKQGQMVRLLFAFKKIYFKDHALTFPLELQQIDLA